MRVVFVAATTHHHPGADPDRAARVDGVAEALAARGHEVTVLTTRWWPEDTTSMTREGVTYRGLTDGPGPVFAAVVPWVLRELEPAVTHVVHEDPGVVIAAEFGNAPVVVDWYDLPVGPGDGLWGSVQTWMRRRAARSPAAVVTPSRLVQTSVRALGRPGDDVHVVPTGIEFDAVRSVEPVDRGEVVYARHLDEAANLGDLLLALAEFRTLDWRAVVIGDGPERGTYRQQAQDLRIADRVEFAGALPLAERLAAFKGAHAYVHTATRASFPTNLIRAMACGCVGVVSYHEQSSAHEFVDPNERGFLTTSPEEIAGSLMDAADLPHRTVDETYAAYDQEDVIDRYLALYREVRSAVTPR